MVKQVHFESTKFRTDTELELNKSKGDIEKWLELAKAHIDGQGVSGGFGKRSPHKGIDKKEIGVWKLQEELDKSSFRHWDDAVDLQPEMVHDLKHAGFVLNHIRRSKVAITCPCPRHCRRPPRSRSTSCR